MPFSKQLDKILQGKLWRFFGGIKPSGRKSTSHSAIEELAIPSLITLPLDRHLGPDGQLLVSVGDYVKAGQPLTIPGGDRAVPLHASTSGDIVGINMQVLPHASGYLGRCITIKPDGRDEKVEDQPMHNWREKDAKELLERIRAFGVEGLGGAQFQTAAKIAAALEESKGDCNIFIVNGAECEPVATCDDRLMQEKAEDIIQGIEVVRHILKPKVTIVAIEDNKPDAIKAMQEAIKHQKLNEKEVFVRVIPTVYPSGAARNLIKICTGIEIPYNEHTSECGIVVDNVETVFAIKQAVIDGTPLIKRVITVDGQTLGRSGNALVRLGTSVRFVLNAYKLNPERRQRVIVGGPFMGFTLPTIDVPITKSATCIYVPSYKELEEQEQQMNCIRCGRCARVCPSRLAPYLLYAQSRAGQHKQTKASGMMDCTECGCCAYVCPSRIPLSNQFRKEKAILRLLADSQKRNERAQERIAARNERLKKEEEQRKKRVAAARARMALNASANAASGAAGTLEQDELAKRRAAAVEAARARAAAKRAAAAKKEEERLAALGKTPAPRMDTDTGATGAVDNSNMYDENGNIKVTTAEDVARIARSRAILEAARAAKAKKAAAEASGSDSAAANAASAADETSAGSGAIAAGASGTAAGGSGLRTQDGKNAARKDDALDLDDDDLFDGEFDEDGNPIEKEEPAPAKPLDPVAKAHAMMQQSKDGMLVAAMMNQGGTSAMIKYGNKIKEEEPPKAPEPTEILPYALRKGGAPKHAPEIHMWPEVETREKDMRVVENPPEDGVIIPESRPRSKTYLTAPEIIAKKNSLPARLRRADYVEEIAEEAKDTEAQASAATASSAATSAASAAGTAAVSATGSADLSATKDEATSAKADTKSESAHANATDESKSGVSAQQASDEASSDDKTNAANAANSENTAANSAKVSAITVKEDANDIEAKLKALKIDTSINAFGNLKPSHKDAVPNALNIQSHLKAKSEKGESDSVKSPSTQFTPNQFAHGETTSPIKSSFTAKVITKSSKDSYKKVNYELGAAKPSFGATHVNGAGFKGASTVVENAKDHEKPELIDDLKDDKKSIKKKRGFFSRRKENNDNHQTF